MGVLWIAGFLAGLFGAMGLGGGGILIIYLTLFERLDTITAQGINLIFFAFMSLVATITYSYKKLVNWRIVFSMSFFGIVGSVCGFYVSHLVDSRILGKFFGAFMLVVGFLQLFKSGAEGKRGSRPNKSESLKH